ncbi:unnamed protein product [Meloidogyne enterolobii]|uniref:Uncharacterized protein n=1 Tax=Meloidogyne enterolobii TaxID=390850 RepID=A0ACB0XK59_MELEN
MAVSSSFSAGFSLIPIDSSAQKFSTSFGLRMSSLSSSVSAINVLGELVVLKQDSPPKTSPKTV